MSASGRAGLFTMDNGPFFYDLRGSPYTAEKRQKSGALRLEFGTLTLTNAGTTSATVTTTINTGIAAFASLDRLPTPVVSESSGYYGACTGGPFTSAKLTIFAQATGRFSGWISGCSLSYMVIGY